MRATSVSNANGNGNDINAVFEEWPWIAIQKASMEGEWGHYAPASQMDQYTLEVIVNTIFTHPDSCLRTYDPESAKLFHVPFYNSIHFHNGKTFAQDYSTTNYAQALMDIMERENYDSWQKVWGITDKYWKRRGGADHVSVMTEPLHGFWHPRNKRGSFHFIHSQYQLRPHIVISVELSTSFVETYPKCAAKNIIVPYPNPDGRHYNGQYDADTSKYLLDELQIDLEKDTLENFAARATPIVTDFQLGLFKHANATTTTTKTNTSKSNDIFHRQYGTRPIGVFYSGGLHGTCRTLRKSLMEDYICSPSGNLFHNKLKKGKHITSFQNGMRMSTFCPCPGGDSPSAKRMYDATIAGCIPIILSKDFVWALSIESDPESSNTMIDPTTFSIRLDSSPFVDARLDKDTCDTFNQDKPPLTTYLETHISPEEIQRLRQGLEHAKTHYSFYSHEDKDIPTNALKHNILPTGGVAFALIAALEDRAEGKRWPACEAELKTIPKGTREPNHFLC